MSTLIQRSGIILAATATALAVAAAAATPAGAVSDEITGTVEAGLGLNVHSGSPGGAVIDTMPGGSVLRTYCWTTGPTISASWGGSTWTTSVWDAIDGYTTPSGQDIEFVGGTKVFASDAWINTGGDTSTMVRHC
jgi:hypothetical protein